MNTKNNLLRLDIGDAVTKLKNDVKAFQCITDLADAGSLNNQAISLELLVPLLDNLTSQLKHNIDRIDHIIQQ